MSSRRLISYAEFAAKVAAEREEDFTWADLDRFDYDPPKERCALVSWCLERVDEHGEVHAGYWNLFRAGDSRELAKLHDYGVMCFGMPPWRRSQVLVVFGRLGSVEAAVKALPAPGDDFSYSFAYDAPVASEAAGKRVSAASAFATFRRPRVDERSRERARWARARRPDRQGELF